MVDVIGYEGCYAAPICVPWYVSDNWWRWNTLEYHQLSKINRSTWSLSCDSQNETWTKSQLDGEVRHENKSLCGWNRHQPQWYVTKNDSESSSVSYRCPLSQNLLFHRTFVSRIWLVSTKSWRESRFSGPKACCTAESNHTSVFACPELPLYNPTTLPPPCYRGPLATFD